ncbi:hypothetical protein EVA_18585 [gut metagenome]|uniref:Uncharacterized protein n=1 Tax=gut metagenome TaxID=749906 RepID=J9FFU4_9ZZZZ
MLPSFFKRYCSQGRAFTGTGSFSRFRSTFSKLENP